MLTDFFTSVGGFELPWKTIIIASSASKYVFDLYLRLRQISHIKSLSRPHTALQGQISQEKFDDAKSYKLALLCFNIASGLWGQITNVLMVLVGITMIWDLSASIQQTITSPNMYWQSVIFLVMYPSVLNALNLPSEYYDTFHVEGTFGFNNMSRKDFFIDQSKTFVITGIILAAVASGSLKIISLAGDSFFVYLFPAIICFQLFIQTIYPLVILPLFFSLKPVEYGPLRQDLEGLASKLKFPLHDLYVIDGSSRSSHSNAFFTGFPWKKQIFLFDTLLKHMDDTEVVGVLAHELGHWSLSHTFVLLAVGQLDTVITLGTLAAFIHNESLYEAFHIANSPVAIGFVVVCHALPLALGLTTAITNTVTRFCEYGADEFASQQGYRTAVARALVKLQKENLGVGSDDWLYSCYYNSHPSTVERLERLKCTEDESTPLLHDEQGQ